MVVAVGVGVGVVQPLKRGRPMAVGISPQGEAYPLLADFRERCQNTHTPTTYINTRLETLVLFVCTA